MELSATIIILLLLFGGLTVLFLLMLRDTFRRKGVWGINLEPVKCPRCREPLPMVRKPASVSQAFWGGWTCSECGCEIDKWCVEIPQTETSFTIPPGLEAKNQIPLERHYQNSRTPLEKVIIESELESGKER